MTNTRTNTRSGARTARRQALALGLTLALTVASPGVQAGPAADKYIERARTALQKGDVNAGVIELKNALQEEPDNAAARLLLGQTYLRGGDLAAAEKELARTRDLGLPRAQWVVDYARTLMLLGQADRVLKEFSPLDDDPPETRASLLSLQALALMAQKQLDDAKTRLNEALAAKADNVEALLAMTRLEGAEGKFAEASERVNQVLAVQPDNVEALLLLAELERLQKRYPEAIAAFDKVLARNPKELRALVGRGETRLTQGDADGALADGEAARRLRSNLPAANFLRGRALLAKKNLPAAQEALLEVLRFVPDHLPSQLLLGAIAFQNNNLEQADAYLSRYVAAVPNQLPARKLLAGTAMKLKQPKRAIDLLAPVAAAGSNDAQLLALLGSAYLQAGDHDKAAALLQKASELAPNASPIRAQHALSLLASGDTDKAIDELETASELNQGLVQADVMLVLTLLQTRDFERAAKTAQALAEKEPKSAMPLNLLGIAEMGQNDLVSARKAFEQALAVDPKFTVAELNLAQIDLRENKPEAAEARYQAVVARDPGNVQALLALAERAQQPVQAVQWLEQAWEKNPDSLQVGLLLAQRYLQRGDRLKASGVVRQLETAQPNNPVVQRMLGAVLFASEDIGGARAAYRKFADAQPNNPEGWFLIASTYLREKDDTGAEQALQRALNIDPKYAPALAGRIELALRGRREAEFRKQVEALRNAFPDSPLPQKYEGDWELQANRPQNAALSYAAAYQRSPSGPLALQLASARLRAADQAGALAALKDWVDRSPEDYITRLQYAIELQNQKQADPAIEQYRKVVGTQPRSVIALNNLAWLLSERKDPEAVGFAEKARELAPESPEVADTLGWVLAQAGKVDRGLQILQQAAVQAPHLGDIRYHLAAVLNQAGRKDEAIRELERLLGEGRSFEQQEAAKALLAQLKK